MHCMPWGRLSRVAQGLQLGREMSTLREESFPNAEMHGLCNGLPREGAKPPFLRAVKSQLDKTPENIHKGKVNLTFNTIAITPYQRLFSHHCLLIHLFRSCGYVHEECASGALGI